MTRRVVVIANAPVDETYAVESLPRPGESMIGTFLMRDLGGKGANVATVLARAGIGTTLVAAVGDDERGTFVRERLAAEPLETSLVTAAGLPTDLSIIYSTPDGDNAIVTTVAATRSLDPAHAIRAMDTMTAGDVVVLQGNLVREVSFALIGAARSRALVIALNPSPLVPWLHDAIAHVQMVFANEAEAETLSGGERGERAIRSLLARGPEHVVVTRGAAGSALGTRTGAVDAPDAFEIVTTPAVRTDVVDTTGAGDTFMAVALASAARRDVPLDERALEHAALAAALTVGRKGAVSAFPSVPELDGLWGADRP